MTNLNISHQRLNSLGMLAPNFETPADVVHWLGAVQSQDYAGAKWALGMRMKHTTDEFVEKAFTDGSILRTHLLRPTWHFVTPSDIRWILKLTAPRVHAASAYMLRKVELDDKIFKRSNAALEKALQGEKHRTRDELQDALEKAGIKTAGELRMTYLMMQAELDGVVCSGPRRGKQFTYMLLEERVPQAGKLSHDEALAELSKRYFTSRGPATVYDFSKWSGLTITDAKLGMEIVKPLFQSKVMDGQTYWFKEPEKSAVLSSPVIHMLSVYDEYISSYKDRSAMATDKDAEKMASMGNDLTNIILINGQAIGTWKRTLNKKEVIITPNFFIPLKKAEREAFNQTAEEYGEFLELSVVIRYE
jgi:hypothetical protein